MARKKSKTKLSKVTATRESPVQPGTVELHAPGMFGERAARIRSNREVAAVMPRGPEIEKMLGEIFREPGLPPHGTGNLEISLARNREIQARMVQRAQAAAETVWPGFNAMMQVMIERENEYITALGVVGVGVA